MAELLSISGLSVGYGEAAVLQGIDFSVRDGEALALLGRNGTGKTTLINSIVGITRRFAGSVRLAGNDVTHLSADRRVQHGIGWVPQERNIFKSLSVEENLSAIARPGHWTAKKIYQMFPRLAERRRNMGNQLSGGEQQMLAVGRALMLNPKLLLLDEPLEGLAPVIVQELLAAMQGIMNEHGLALIIVEQNARKILPLTDSAIVLDRGCIIHRGDSDSLLKEDGLLERLLTV